MKFKIGEYYKHPANCCQFIKVVEIFSDDGNCAFLKVKWGVQGHDDWKFNGVEEQINVTPHRYPHWRNYAPWGEEL